MRPSSSAPASTAPATVLTAALTAVATAATLGVLSVSGVAATPDRAAAGGREFTTVAVADRARLDACRMSIKKGKKVRIRARIDNTGSGRKVRAKGSIVATFNGEPRDSLEIGRTRGGAVSKVRSLVLPDRTGYRLEVAVSVSSSGSGSGSGGTIAYEQVGRC